MDKKSGKSKIAVANADTISSMNKDWINKVQKGVFKDYEWSREEEIEIETLANMIKKHGTPKFVKIDVEGYELNVLQGLDQPVPYLSFEFMLPQFYEETVKCIKQIDTLGMHEYNVSFGESMEFELEGWMSSEEFQEYLAKEKSRSDFGDIYAREV